MEPSEHSLSLSLCPSLESSLLKDTELREGRGASERNIWRSSSPTVWAKQVQLPILNQTPKAWNFGWLAALEMQSRVGSIIIRLLLLLPARQRSTFLWDRWEPLEGTDYFIRDSSQEDHLKRRYEPKKEWNAESPEVGKAAKNSQPGEAWPSLAKGHQCSLGDIVQKPTKMTHQIRNHASRRQ